jgi:hypothetical protein
MATTEQQWEGYKDYIQIMYLRTDVLFKIEDIIAALGRRNFIVRYETPLV